MTKAKYGIQHDISLIALSIIVAVLLVKSNVLSDLLSSTSNLKFIGSFIAGLFFTSLFTTAPAIVTLGQIATSANIIEVSFFGAVGAVIGDLIIFQFVKDQLSVHFAELMTHNSVWKRMKVLFKLKYFRWITLLIGGAIIASPLPDELGIGLLGASKMKTRLFVPISFIFNFIGIYLIGLVARAL